MQTVSPPIAAQKRHISIEIRPSELGFHRVLIDRLDSYPISRLSPSGRWAVVWKSLPATLDDAGKPHLSGTCKLLDIEQQALILDIPIMRPNYGMVANNGTFSIEDALDRESLSGQFRVYTRSGQLLLDMTFDANILNSCVSHDGRFALCQTANNPNGEHGDRLIVVDLITGRVLFNISPTSLGTSYDFGAGGQDFLTAHTNIGAIRYAMDGSAEIVKTGYP